MKFSNEVLTTEEVRGYLRISRDTLMREIKSGRLKARKIGRRYRILGDDLQAYLDNPRGAEE